MAMRGKIVLTKPRVLGDKARPAGASLGEVTLADYLVPYHLGIVRSLLASGGAELQVEAEAGEPAGKRPADAKK
ncbi:MAG TPA: hypothetical protein PLE19_12695 [Planctomycetota bacterium]|nr:hypothetical protein [Planctomycetota bacterium]HRT95527.1 hypothetical protein [Planctomycetota bacterium]